MRIGIVVQRYGEDLAGGSEYLARLYAKQLSKLHDVLVLTTCARNYTTWANEYPEGSQEVEGVSVLRFPVAAERDFARFSQISYRREITSHTSSFAEERAYFDDQGPLVPNLVNYLELHQDEFDSFVFFTYLYYPTSMGLPKVAHKSYLVCTAHDEPPFYFWRTFAPIFSSVKGLIYLSNEERRFVHSIYPVPSNVVELKGMFGINPPAEYTPEEDAEFRIKFRDIISHMYFIYLGRACHPKNCQALIDAFSNARHMTKAIANLVFCGSSDMEFPSDRPDIHYVGFVSEKEKTFLLRHAVALVNPSPLESLSLVMLEAWNHGTAVIVNGESKVMSEHCLKAQAGLYFNSSAMFEGVMAWAMANIPVMRALGIQGMHYVHTNYTWKRAYHTTLKHIKSRKRALEAQKHLGLGRETPAWGLPP